MLLYKNSRKERCAMSEASHVAGWPSEGPTAAQLKEFFAQIQAGRVTGTSLQGFLRGPKQEQRIVSSFDSETSPFLLKGPYRVVTPHGRKAVSKLLKLGGYWQETPFFPANAVVVGDDTFPNERDEDDIFDAFLATFRSDRCWEKDTIQLLREEGFVPVTTADMLALSYVHPDLEIVNQLLALGQFAQSSRGELVAGCVSWNRLSRAHPREVKVIPWNDVAFKRWPHIYQVVVRHVASLPVRTLGEE